MNIRKFTSIALLVALALPTFAGASEVTGTLTTGISNGIEGTVVPLPVVTPPPVGGGGGGGGGGGIIAQATFKKSDADHNGVVNILDFVQLMADWGKTGPNIKGDFTGDNRVDILDFVQLMADWTK